MSDPFDALRDPLLSDASPPDVVAIRARAGRIERRRRVAVSGAAFVVVAVAVTGVLVRTGPSTLERDLAGPRVTTGASSAGEASGTTALSGSAAPAPEAKQRAAGRMAGTAGATYDSAASAKSVSEPALTATVTAAKGAQPHHEKLTLEVCNPNDQTVERRFSSSERYDFDVSRDGKLVWRWSHDRTFTQQTGSETWAAHACRRWTVDWDGMDDSGAPAGPGSYQVVGVLTTSPPQRSKPVSFCLDIC